VKVLLTGATGFVGSEVLKQLMDAGHSVRVLARTPSSFDAFSRKDELDLFCGNILHAPSIAGCMDGIEAVIHLVGIISETGENTYDRVHRIGTQSLIAEAKKTKVKRFIHMSALGTRTGARSQYHQSKWAAEEAVNSSGLDWTIFRPSIVYGPNDGFVNLFARMTRSPLKYLQLWTLPVIGGGYSYLQPIPVSEVARCFVGALTKPESFKKTYDLCGPERLRLREIIKIIAETLGHDTKEIAPPLKRWIGDWSNLLLPFSILQGIFIQPKLLLAPVPIEVATVIAWFMETFSSRPLPNRDQLLMLEEDNVGDPSEAMKDFGISPPDFHQGISSYLLPANLDELAARTYQQQRLATTLAAAAIGILLLILIFGKSDRPSGHETLHAAQGEEAQKVAPSSDGNTQETEKKLDHAQGVAVEVATPSETSPAPSAVVESTTGERGVSGKVTLNGKPPSETPIQLASDPSCKAMHTSGAMTRHYVLDANGNLANVFVYVKDGLAGKKFPAPASSVLLDQQGCLYQPYVLGIQAGQTLVIQNSDATMHNVHALGKNNPEFNVGQPTKGMKMEKTFNKPEVFVRFKCDVHPWMFAYVGVMDHPFFVVTGANGNFRINDLPDGEYTLAALHPKAGEQTAKIKVAGGGVKVDFTFTPKTE